MSSSSLRLARGAYVDDVTALYALLRDRRRLPMAVESTRAAPAAPGEPARACSGTTPSAAAAPPRSATVFGAARARRRPRARVRRHGRDGRRFALRRRPPPLAPCSSGASAASPSSRSSRAPTSPPRATCASPPPPSRSLGARRAPLRPDASHPFPSPSASPTTPSSSGPSAATTRSPRAVSAAWSAQCDPCSIPRPPRLHHGRPRGRRRHHLQRGPTLGAGGAPPRPTRTRTRTSPTPRDDAAPWAILRGHEEYHARHVGGGRRARVSLGRRAARAWSVPTRDLRTRDARVVAARLVAFGHRPRVGLSRGERGRRPLLVTAGEDCTVRLWDAPADLVPGLIKSDSTSRGTRGRRRRRTSPSPCFAAIGSRGVARVDPSRGERPRRARHRGRGRLHQAVGSLRTRRRRVVGVVTGDVCVSPARRRRRGGPEPSAGVTDSKGEYVRALALAAPDVLFVATNHGVLSRDDTPRSDADGRGAGMRPHRGGGGDAIMSVALLDPAKDGSARVALGDGAGRCPSSPSPRGPTRDANGIVVVGAGAGRLLDVFRCADGSVFTSEVGAWCDVGARPGRTMGNGNSRARRVPFGRRVLATAYHARSGLSVFGIKRKRRRVRGSDRDENRNREDALGVGASRGGSVRARTTGCVARGDSRGRGRSFGRLGESRDCHGRSRWSSVYVRGARHGDDVGGGADVFARGWRTRREPPPPRKPRRGGGGERGRVQSRGGETAARAAAAAAHRRVSRARWRPRRRPADRVRRQATAPVHIRDGRCVGRRAGRGGGDGDPRPRRGVQGDVLRRVRLGESVRAPPRAVRRVAQTANASARPGDGNVRIPFARG